MTDHNYDYMAYLIGAEEFSKYKPTFPKGSFQQAKNLTDKKVYTHSNGYKYTLHNDQLLWPGQTYCIPYPGQGMDDLPRYLSTGNLRDADGELPHVDYRNSPFKAGDIVKLVTGSAAIKVTLCSQNHLWGEYLSGNHRISCRSVKDFEFHPDNQQEEDNTMTTNTNKLYTWKHTYTTLDAASIESPDLYGHYLATNSQGEWVMEVKGSGQIMAVAKDKVQEVLPYTIGVKFGKNSQVYHYLAEKDKFSVGFYLVASYNVDGFQVAHVTQVDTKSGKATVEFNPLGKLAVDLY